MQKNHELLNQVGVGHEALDNVVRAARDQGFACKLTGAGGGGCAIVLSSVAYSEPNSRGSEGRSAADAEALDRLDSLVQAIRLAHTKSGVDTPDSRFPVCCRALGYDVHHSSVGGKGVLWLV
jgi:mevalonate kinase